MEQHQAVTAPLPQHGDAVQAHPEEMTASVALHLGGGGSFVATARATPAGLISVGVLVSSILLSVAVLTRAAKTGAAK